MKKKKMMVVFHLMKLQKKCCKNKGLVKRPLFNLMVKLFMSDRDIHFNQFVRNLEENSIAKKYYLSRGLSKKLIKDNLMGFCPVYSRYIFPLLRGRLIIPIRDIYGNTISLAGRQIQI